MKINLGFLENKGLYEDKIPYFIYIGGGDCSIYDIGFHSLKAALMRLSNFVEMNEYLVNQN